MVLFRSSISFLIFWTFVLSIKRIVLKSLTIVHLSASFHQFLLWHSIFCSVHKHLWLLYLLNKLASFYYEMTFFIPTMGYHPQWMLSSHLASGIFYQGTLLSACPSYSPWYLMLHARPVTHLLPFHPSVDVFLLSLHGASAFHSGLPSTHKPFHLSLSLTPIVERSLTQILTLTGPPWATLICKHLPHYTWVPISTPVPPKGETFQKGDLPYKCTFLLQKGKFYSVFRTPPASAFPQK